MSTTITRLQAWYSAQCDGEWEEELGISVETLDNPGWSVSIDLVDTPLEHQAYQGLRLERSDHDWITCRRNATQFEGFGGPTNLEEILEQFLMFAGS